MINFSVSPSITSHATTKSKFYNLTNEHLSFRIAKPRVALKYLKMALQLEQDNSQTTGAELAATHLNLCAIHSEL